MLPVYLFSLVLGGGFLLLSVLGGDADAELDIDLDGGDAAGSGKGTDATRILSFRTVVYALFAFGATGALLDRLGVGPGAGLAASLATGLAAGISVGALFAWLGRTGSGDLPGDDALVGRAGQVTIPLSGSVPGTVVVRRGDRRIALRALPYGTSDPTPPEEWSDVVVVEITDGIARVARAAADLRGEP